jgi:outer membrane protein assembly factor BamB
VRLSLLLAAALVAATPAAATPPAPASGCAGLLLRASDGLPVAGIDEVHGSEVRAVVADGRGGWYVGGDFWRVGTLPLRNLAHLDATGRADPRFDAQLDGQVDALALAGGTLYVAGAFHHVAGAMRSSVAALDAATGKPTQWTASAPADIDEVAVADGTVYLGSSSAVAAVDARTGAALQPPPAVGSPFALARDVLYAKSGGRFYGALSAYSLPGGTPLPWADPARGYFSALLAKDGRVLAAGRFTTAGRRRVRLAVWEASSGRLVWRARVGGGALAFVNAVASSGGRVYLGGLFSTLDGRARPRLGAVDAATGRAVAWAPRWNARSWTPLALAADRGRVFVGSAVTSPRTDLPRCARRP